MFGTFIEEKDEVKPIYGTVKPLNSWNPIKANVDVYWMMLRDSFATKSWRDKFKVWFQVPDGGQMMFLKDFQFKEMTYHLLLNTIQK